MTSVTAPELNRTAVVGHDGRISLPLIEPIMAADRSTAEVQAAVSRAYEDILVDPRMSVAVKTAQPLKVFVGGEVEKGGVYDMPGDINALQAVIQAGGFKTTARRDKVVIIRRGPDGRAMMRTVDLRAGIFEPGTVDPVPLRRFDIVYVPRSSVVGDRPVHPAVHPRPDPGQLRLQLFAEPDSRGFGIGVGRRSPARRKGLVRRPRPSKFLRNRPD